VCKSQVPVLQEMGSTRTVTAKTMPVQEKSEFLCEQGRYQPRRCERRFPEAARAAQKILKQNVDGQIT